MIVEGSLAPDFALFDQEGREVRLGMHRGSAIVLFFYPKDDTPGCTTEACAFRDAEPDFRGSRAIVFGISPDPIRSHARFAAKYQLPFPILADPENEVCRAYGVWKEKSMYGRTYMGVERTTFVIDPEGVVRKVFVKVKVAAHAAAVLAAVRELP